MTTEEIYNKARQVAGLNGMTTNERLWESGLMDEFDLCLKNDKGKAQIILEALQIDEISIIRILGNKPIIKYPNPWDFSSTISFDEYGGKLIYEDLNEIGMGAPISGNCFLINQENRNILINNRCAGPPIINDEKTKIAIPIWTNSFFRGTYQKLSIIDLNELTLTTFKKPFQVLDLRTFKKNIIIGFDSPKYKTKIVEFDIQKERIIERMKLK